MKSIRFIYHFRFLTDLVYILQQSEYRAKIYLKWLWRTEDFSLIQNRGQLDMTKAAKLLLASLVAISALLIMLSLHLIYQSFWVWENSTTGFFALTLFFAWPVVVAHLAVIPMWVGRFLVIIPLNKRRNEKAKAVFSKVKAKKIAIAGSYGKTTMKEALATVLTEGLDIKYTKGNLNTAVAHARFADEISKGLDPIAARKIRQFVKDYAKEKGKTVIITSQIMSEIEELCGVDTSGVLTTLMERNFVKIVGHPSL